MSAEVPGISGLRTRMPIDVNSIADFAKGLNINEEGAALVKEVLGILASDPSVRVTNTTVNRAVELGRPVGATGIPKLDTPYGEHEIDSERLMSELYEESNEKASLMGQERIKGQKDQLKKTYKQQKDDLANSYKEMDKARTGNKFGKLFGWICAAIAVVVAVTVSIASGGIAVGPVLGALVAVGGLIDSEVNGDKSLLNRMTEGIASGLQALGFSEMASKIIAQVAVAVGMLIATVALGRIDGVLKIGQVADSIAKSAATIASMARIAQIGGGALSTAMGGINADLNYNAQMAQVDLTDDKRFMATIRQAMEQTSDELQDALTRLQEGYTEMMNIISSKMDNMDTIAMNIGQKA